MFEKTFSFWRHLVGKAQGSPPADAGAQEDRRLWIRHETELQGKGRLAEQAGAEEISTRIRDLSKWGANLLLDRPFQPGQILSLELPTDENAICTVLACVVRLIPEKESQWSLGCVFSREFSDEELSHFGAAKLATADPDQRKWVRYNCELKASFRKVGDPGNQAHAAQVLNISASGIGLSVTPPLDTGCLLNVDLLDKQGRLAHTILACAVHTTLRTNGELAVGCNFIRELTETEFQSLL
jgi:hypothetical protein